MANNVKSGDIARVVGDKQLVEGLPLVQVVVFSAGITLAQGRQKFFGSAGALTHVRACHRSRSSLWAMVPPGTTLYIADSILRKWGGALDEQEVKRLYTSLSKPGAETWAARAKTTTTKVD